MREYGGYLTELSMATFRPCIGKHDEGNNFFSFIDLLLRIISTEFQFRHWGR